MENKLKLFQGKSIRSAWNEEEQQWYFLSSTYKCNFLGADNKQ